MDDGPEPDAADADGDADSEEDGDDDGAVDGTDADADGEADADTDCDAEAEAEADADVEADTGCVPESCNGLDDDCDTVPDNGYFCVMGSTVPCTTDCGTAGSAVCGSICAEPSVTDCLPPGETCNGEDDDCDTATDEGFACVLGAAGSCTTTCGSTGNRSCGTGCTWGICTAGEICGNGVDDDCDGLTDEGCPSVPNDTCSAPTVITAGNTYAGTLTGALHQYTGSCGTTNGPDVVYQLSHAGGDLFVGVLSTAFNPTVYISATCGTSSYCNDNAYTGVNASVLILSNLAAGTYYIIVDAPTGASGSFTIETYRTGNQTAGDLCGEPLRLFNGVTGNTCDSWVWDDYASSCSSDCYDIVYYFVKETPSSAITVSSCGSSYDSVMFMRDDCDSTPDTACNHDNGPSCTGTRASIGPTVGPGIYFVFMDGYYSFSCACGSFTLTTAGF